MELITLVYVLLIVALAKAMGEVVTRFDQPTIVGELLAGIVLGPFVLGAAFTGLKEMYSVESEPGKFISDLADFGMLFLMLYAGMQFSTKTLMTSSWKGVGISVLGIVLPFVLGYVAGTSLGYSGTTLLFLALACAVTALPVTVRVLVDLEVLRTRTGSTIVSAAIVTDVSLILTLGLLLSSAEGRLDSLEVLVLAVGFVLFFVVAVLIGRYVVPHIYAGLKRMRTGEAAFAVAIAFAISFAVLAERLGLPGVIGAFIAGVLLRQTGAGLKVWTHVKDVLSGVTLGFLAPIFFVLIGFSVDFEVVASSLGLLSAVIAVAVVGKIAGSYIPARAWGMSHNESMAIGSMMMGKGAMELVFARIALEERIIGEEIFSVLVLMAFLSTALAPAMFKTFFNRAASRGEIPRGPVDVGDVE
ncbi:MAG: cation:proton antiporter [Thermoplasmata archaeon]